jgi:cytidine deaminase
MAIISAEKLRQLMLKLGEAARQELLRVLRQPELRGQIPAPALTAVLRDQQLRVDDFMLNLLPVAQLRAFAPLSNFRVGAVACGTSGSLYLGANLEVPLETLGNSVHAEQAAIVNAFMHEESGVTSLAVTAAPCGHCRQFLNELPNASDLDILVKGQSAVKLGAMLPSAFGPNDLGVSERLFGGKKVNLVVTSGSTDELTALAVGAASRSYAPYTNAVAGVALRTSVGTVYEGCYIESAAFNPSLSPLQAALVGLIMSGESPSNITAATLAELENAPITQENVTGAVLDALAPAASLRRVTVRVEH